MRIIDWSSDVCSSDLTRKIDAQRLQRIGSACFGRSCAITVLGHRHATGGYHDGNRRRDIERVMPVSARTAHIYRICRSADGYHARAQRPSRSEEHKSELQSLMRNTYSVVCLKKKKKQ